VGPEQLSHFDDPRASEAAVVHHTRANAACVTAHLSIESIADAQERAVRAAAACAARAFREAHGETIRIANGLVARLSGAAVGVACAAVATRRWTWPLRCRCSRRRRAGGRCWRWPTLARSGATSFWAFLRKCCVLATLALKGSVAAVRCVGIATNLGVAGAHHCLHSEDRRTTTTVRSGGGDLRAVCSCDPVVAWLVVEALGTTAREATERRFVLGRKARRA